MTPRHQLGKHMARRFVRHNIAWLLAINSLVLGRPWAAAEDQIPTKPVAEHWIDHQLRKGNYQLSLSEAEGLHSCSVRDGKVPDVELEREFVTVIFHDDPPRFFASPSSHKKC